jgi:hypothetical protein
LNPHCHNAASKRLFEPVQIVEIKNEYINPIIAILMANDKPILGPFSSPKWCALGVVHTLVGMMRPGCLPIFTTDGLKLYFYALTAHFGQWKKRGWVQADLASGSGTGVRPGQEDRPSEAAGPGRAHAVIWGTARL